MDTYKSVAWEMGLPTERSRAALFRVIHTEVSRLCLEARIEPMLIIDDAHHLRSDILEDLRLLTNYQMDSENRLRCHEDLARRPEYYLPWVYRQRMKEGDSPLGPALHRRGHHVADLDHALDLQTAAGWIR